jgi:hypothetical protein
MDIEPQESHFSFDRRMARRFAKVGAIGLPVSIVVYVLAGVAKESVPIPSLRVVLAGLGGLALGVSICSALFALAGGLAVMIPSWTSRKVVGLTLVILASLIFIFIPICWDQKSDDCRSLVERARAWTFARTSP